MNYEQGQASSVGEFGGRRSIPGGYKINTSWPICVRYKLLSGGVTAATRTTSPEEGPIGSCRPSQSGDDPSDAMTIRVGFGTQAEAAVIFGLFKLSQPRPGGEFTRERDERSNFNNFLSPAPFGPPFGSSRRSAPVLEGARQGIIHQVAVVVGPLRSRKAPVTTLFRAHFRRS